MIKFSSKSYKFCKKNASIVLFIFLTDNADCCAPVTVPENIKGTLKCGVCDGTIDRKLIEKYKYLLDFTQSRFEDIKEDYLSKLYNISLN